MTYSKKNVRKTYNSWEIIMNRFKAFAIHFAISFVIFLIVLYFILVHWYPEPLFSTDGGWRIIRIVAGVHLVLGPLLTLVVFRLRADLSIIASLQTIALTLGVFIISNEHPAAIIYTFDHFTPVPAKQLAKVGITANKLKEYGEERPILIFNNIPKEKENKLLLESMKTGKQLYLFTEYYTKFSKKHTKVLQQSSMNLEKYVEDKPELKKRYQRTLYKVRPLKLISLI